VKGETLIGKPRQRDIIGVWAVKTEKREPELLCRNRARTVHGGGGKNLRNPVVGKGQCKDESENIFVLPSDTSKREGHLEVGGHKGSHLADWSLHPLTKAKEKSWERNPQVQCQRWGWENRAPRGARRP